MSVELKMPKMGLTMTTGTVTRWLKKEGDSVSKGDAVIEITTEKITNTVEAPEDGVLIKIFAPEGSEHPIGAVLGIIGGAGENEAKAEMAVKSPEVSFERKKVTPAAAKLAKELRIDCNLLEGTGPGGRVTREDVERAASQPSAEKVVEDVNIKTEKQECVTVSEALPYMIMPYSGMRKAIGDNMSKSWAVAPKVTHHVYVDVTRLMELRKMINEDADEEGKVSITDLIVKIAAKAIEMRPNVNVSLDGSNIKVFKDINIGIAVAIDSGLVVPVIKNADKKSLFVISKEVKDLARKARENSLSMSDMEGGTFTITNVGAYGSVDFFTPIINQPQSAILGLGRIAKGPAVVGDEIVPRHLMGLSFAFDHRVVDGAPAAEFLSVLIKLIEKPAKSII